jgi:UDPglucose 6-dehydrogenase
MRICVIGTGYVGLVCGAGLAAHGNDVICADRDEAKIAALVRGEIPIFEPGLEPLVKENVEAERLSFTTDVPSAISRSEVIFIAVGTPQGEDGSADLQHVLDVARTIAQHLGDGPVYADGEGPGPVIVLKSTVPVGTNDRVRELIAQITQKPFAVVSNPEFLKEGDAVNDFMKPDRIIIGATDPRAGEILRDLYAPYTRTHERFLMMDPRSAELTKYAANAFLATRISFMNEMANLCEAVGADVEWVRRGMGSDARIGHRFLFPGVGYGGSCFPKDVKALLATATTAQGQGTMEIVRAVDRVNERQKLRLADKIERHFAERGESVKGKRIAVWGLSFKPRTDDIREAPALRLIERLLEQGAQVVAHDPAAMEATRRVLGHRIEYADHVYPSVERADALALCTEWFEFRHPDFPRIKKAMRSPVVFDGRNLWDPSRLKALGFTYYGIGRA